MTTLGVMTMSHGVPAGPRALEHPTNVETVRHLVALDLPVPHEHVFMQIPGQLQPGIDRLVARGCDLIVGVFLYPPSVNREITNPRAELGYADRPVYDFPFTPVITGARVILGRSMQAHPLLARILADRLLAVARNPKEQGALIIVHGDLDRRSHLLQVQMAEELAGLIRTMGLFREVAWSSLYPTVTTREVAQTLLDRTGSIVAVSDFLEDTYFNRERIPAGLADLPDGSCTYNGDPLLPHPEMRGYILARLVEALVEHGLGSLVPESLAGIHCQARPCRLDGDTRIARDEKPLGCLAAECGWPA